MQRLHGSFLNRDSSDEPFASNIELREVRMGLNIGKSYKKSFAKPDMIKDVSKEHMSTSGKFDFDKGNTMYYELTSLYDVSSESSPNNVTQYIDYTAV